MYQSIHTMDPKAQPPRREQPMENRVNLVSEMRRQKREHEERLARLDADEAAWRERTARIVAEAKELAATIICDAVLQAEAITAVAIEEVDTRPVPVNDIIRAVAEKHGVTVAAIKGLARTRDLVAARHEAMTLAYEARPDLSLPVLGKAFKRDHTTVLHAVQKSGAWRGSALYRRTQEAGR